METNSQNFAGNKILPKRRTLEDKVDLDFLFYLSYTREFFGNIEEQHEVDLCQAWLNKLCAQSVTGINAKRVRNIYLSKLVLAMQEGQLTGPFCIPPPIGKLPDATMVFGGDQPELVEAEPDYTMPGEPPLPESFTHHSADGRTYVASKELPNGRGAFGFVAITLGEKSLEGEYNDPTSDQSPGSCSGDGYSESIPEGVSTLLSERCSESDRNRLLRFYDHLADSIQDELNGVSKATDHVNILIRELEIDLRDNCMMDDMRENDPKSKRVRLLEILKQRIAIRRQQLLERESALDELEKWFQSSLNKSGPHEKVLWQEAESDIKPLSMELLKKFYPDCLIQRFLELLKKEKHKIVKKQRERLQMFEEEVRKDQIAIVKEGLEKYKMAKEEWREVAEVVDKIQKESENKKAGQTRLKATMAKASKSGKHMHTLIEELNKEQEEYELGIRKNKQLREQLQMEMEKIQGIVATSGASRDRMRKENNNLREEMKEVSNDIQEREKRCKELEDIIAEEQAAGRISKRFLAEHFRQQNIA